MRIPVEEIDYYRRKYSGYSYEERVESSLKTQIQDRFKQGKYFLTRELFLGIANWKTPRQRKNYEKNSSLLVAEVSRISFEDGRNEKIRIEILTLLDGVNYPVASTLLHFAFPNQYPILDFRSIWSLEMEKPSIYSFNFWWNFVEVMRQESTKLGISIRDLDKALWAYSKESQKPTEIRGRTRKVGGGR